MRKTHHVEDLREYTCLNCDEAFFLAVEQKLVCPNCGNADEDSIVVAEQEETEMVPVEQ